MFITNTTVLGGRGFSICGGGGVLKYASGYPVTLTKTLAKAPQNITVYGASGGVGDYDSVKQAYKIPILFGALPVEYTELEYIKSTGTQYINTNIKGKNSIRAVLDAVYTATNSQRLFGSRINTNSSEFNISSTSGSIYIGYGNSSYKANAIEIDKRYILDLDSGNAYINGELIHTFNSATFNNDLDMLLMASNYNGTISSDNNFKGLLRSCQIYDNDILVRDLIPAKRNSDGEIGMYDTVNNVFYTNQGTGSFIAGAEIPHKTINLYSDAPILLGDDLRVYPKEKKAYRGTTDISSLQDWEQDWKIPKADELTVTADTEVEPGSMEIAYYGKK